MRSATDTFTTADNLKLHTQSWLPDTPPKALVLIVHGLAEHSGRYAHIAAHLVEHGYGVYTVDHRGHGRSDGLRAYFEHPTHPVKDLEFYFRQVQAAHPDSKIFLYAHSLGTLIGLTFLLEHQEKLAGAVISGVPLGVEASQPALLVRAGRVLNTVAPRLPLVALDSKGLSHDPAVVAAYDNDPLVHRGNVRVRMGAFIVDVSRQVRERLGELRLPLLILHGGEDPICPPEGSRILYSGVASPDKTLKVYPGMYHEIHNDVVKTEVLADIRAWLDNHMG